MKRSRDEEAVDHTLEYLLAFDGLIFQLKDDYSLKFEIKRVEPSPTRPHGLSYSITMHDPDGNRILGFDNAHAVRPKGAKYAKRARSHDHWHRREGDKGEPYAFKDADKLIADFFAEVRRICTERGMSDEVIETRTTKRRKP